MFIFAATDSVLMTPGWGRVAAAKTRRLGACRSSGAPTEARRIASAAHTFPRRAIALPTCEPSVPCGSVFPRKAYMTRASQFRSIPSLFDGESAVAGATGRPRHGGPAGAIQRRHLDRATDSRRPTAFDRGWATRDRARVPGHDRPLGARVPRKGLAVSSATQPHGRRALMSGACGR